MYSKRPHTCTYKYNLYFQLMLLVLKQAINHPGDFNQYSELPTNRSIIAVCIVNFNIHLKDLDLAKKKRSNCQHVLLDLIVSNQW